MLDSPEEHVLQSACEALYKFAEKCDENRQELLNLGALEPLLKLVLSEDKVVRRNSTMCLGTMAQNGELNCFSPFCNSGDRLQPLLTLLTSEYAIIQQLSLESLIQITLDAENRAALRELEGLERLVEFVGKKEYDDLHVQALQVLSNCLQDVESMQGIPPLISLLSSDNSEVNESVTLALANLTTANNTNCSEVVDKGGIEPLIALLSDEKPLVQANAAVCLTNLATEGVKLCFSAAVVQSKAGIAVAAFVCDADSRNEFRAEGGLPRLVELLRSGDDDVRRSVAWAVLQCGNDLSTATEICRLGGLDVLGEISLSSTRQSGFAKAARECLLDSNLPAKYAMTGSLSCNNIIQDGFYDCGPMRADSKFLTLEELNSLSPDAHRPIILINSRNPERYVKADDVPTPFPVSSLSIRPQYNIDLRRCQSIQQLAPVSRKSRNFSGAFRPKIFCGFLFYKTEGTDENTEENFGSVFFFPLGSSKSRIMREREEQRQREEEAALSSEISLVQQEEEPSWQPPADEVLRGYIEEVQCNIQPLNSNKEQIEALAKFVSDKMGGPVDRESLSTFSYELPISQLKVELNSNIIPIGKIQTGIFYHRALLFKALADRIAVSCSLVRGQYNRAWNEVLLCDEGQDGQPRFPPKSFIVDLMHFPGRLMSTDAPEATLYQRL
ncbi:PREDICTED: armadillo repeat-containing protein 3-like [Acropora digitifera]|uniref:armadillo repeat-containing protein 3-like n=1 Tax=Acropora digitifera TaxID=70779 RepID=UPI00077ADCDC|nr:PREDICTED: armadillo repeat-containing protein 3-like [Acropora digitifera]